jgi:hypothetical protein
MLGKDGAARLDRSCRSVRNEILYRVKEERTILLTVRMRKVYWIGDNVCRNCLLYHAMEGKLEGTIDVTGRR